MYDLVAAGYKKEVYRETSYTWLARVGRFDALKEVCLVCAKKRTSMTFKAGRISIREGRPDWGAEPGVRYYVIQLGERIADSDKCPYYEQDDMLSL